VSRLLSINSYHYRRGGADAVYFDHAALMETEGWENAFFSMHYPDNKPSSWSRYFVDEIQIGHNYSMAQKFVKATKVIYSFEAKRKLRQLLQDYNPDIAHIHNIYHHLSPSILSVLRHSAVPVVMTAHDLKIACPNNKMLTTDGVCERCKVGRYYQTVLNRCVHRSVVASAIIAAESYLHRWLRSYQDNVNSIIVPSRFFIEKFVEWGWPKQLFTYVPNFVDASGYEPNFRAGRYLVYFGRLSVEKGVDTLIRAAAASGVPVRIVGTGPLEEDLKDLAKNLGAPVEFMGYRTGIELQKLVSESRSTVLPSEWYENAPISVLESLALGKPAIGAEIGGIPEMIRQDETGWLFKSGDVNALAGMLDTVSCMPDAEIEKFGKRARALVEREFSPTRYTNAITDVYRSLGVQMPDRKSTVTASGIL